MSKKAWTGFLRSYGWTHTRSSQPMDHLVLRVAPDREPDRIIEVLVPRETVEQMIAFVQRRTPDEGNIMAGEL